MENSGTCGESYLAAGRNKLKGLAERGTGWNKQVTFNLYLPRSPWSKSQLHRPTMSSRATIEIWHPEIKVVYIAMLMQLFHISKTHRETKMSFQIKILLSLDENVGKKALKK